MALSAALALLSACGGSGPAASGASMTPATRAIGATATVVSTATGGSSPTLTPTVAPVLTPSPSPAGTPATSPAAPTVTPTVSATAAPPRSIAVGEWSFDYYLTSNTCASAPDSTHLPVTQAVEEVNGNDGFISDGEQVRVYDFNGGASLGLLTFHWPTLSYQVPLNEPGGVRVEVTHTFADARTGSSKVVEVYKTSTGTCERTYGG